MLSDLTDFVYGHLAELSPKEVAGLFLVLIIIGAIVAFYSWWVGKNQPIQRAAPSLLTLTGILGTFLGIAIGLVNFDVDNIKESVPDLLSGLKTAFLTSIAGMVGALSFKVVTNYRPYREPEHAKHEIGPEDVHAEIRSSRKATEKMAIEMVNLREEFTRELHEFAKKVSEMGTRHLIEALKQVINDFNRNLTEQFGENFKRLDDSVKKLVDWQSQYANQVERQTEQLNSAVQAIRQSQEALARIEESTRSIPEHMEHQRQVISVLGSETERLEGLLQRYDEMANSAREAIPAIERHIRETVDQIASAASAATEQHQRMRSDIQTALDDQRQATEALFSGLDRQLRESIQKQDHAINERVAKIDEALQEEMRRALQSLANNLGSVTQKFADDYSQLTESMRRVVASADRLSSP